VPALGSSPRDPKSRQNTTHRVGLTSLSVSVAASGPS
jgi:hypothetical protein